MLLLSISKFKYVPGIYSQKIERNCYLIQTKFESSQARQTCLYYLLVIL